MSQRFARNPEAAAALHRLALGTVFLSHAYLKLAVFGLGGTGQWFAAHGFPAWTVYPVAFAELLGGAALVLGVLTRAVALGLVPVMLGALATHAPNGWFFSNPGGGYEYIVFLIAALGVQLILGDGAFALGTRLRAAIAPRPAREAVQAG